MNSQLTNLKLEELIALQTETENLIKAKRKATKKELLQNFKQQAEAAGFTLEEIIGNLPRTSPRKGRKVPPKYRNPNNPSQTWTGRGKQPIWVRDHLAQGNTLESITI